MNTVVHLSIAALVLVTVIILQWAVLRTKYRAALTSQHARHVQQQQITSRHIEQAKRQIGQLQHDLAAARLQVKRLTPGGAAPPQSNTRAKAALELALDDAAASRRHLPTDGFADTQPSPHSPRDIDLLIR